MTSPPEPLGSSAGLLEAITRMVPHNQALGIRFVSLDGERITMALPYAERLVGNPVTGVVHGGAI